MNQDEAAVKKKIKICERRESKTAASLSAVCLFLDFVSSLPGKQGAQLSVVSPGSCWVKSFYDQKRDDKEERRTEG